MPLHILHHWNQPSCLWEIVDFFYFLVHTHAYIFSPTIPKSGQNIPRTLWSLIYIIFYYLYLPSFMRAIKLWFLYLRFLEFTYQICISKFKPIQSVSPNHSVVWICIRTTQKYYFISIYKLIKIIYEFFFIKL